MKKELRIPTLIALLIIIVGLVATSFLTGRAQSLFSRADVTTAVKNLKKTNITDTSFTLSWTTDQSITGVVSYSDSKSGSFKPVEDDRVQAGTTGGKFYTHHVTVRLLKPQTVYYFKIISDKKEYSDPSYTITTGSIIDSGNSVSTPVYGTILNEDNTPASGVLVYVTVNNSSPLSTLTKSSGNWLVTLNNARSADLTTLATFKPQGDIENIFGQAEKDLVVQAKTITGNDAPVPNLILGRSYDFTVENKSQTASTTATPTPTPTVTLAATGFTEGAASVSAPAILIPKKDSAITDSHPTFSGVGIPGQVVQIIVQSEKSMAASVVVGNDGRWSWSPPENLEAGNHTVTIATADSSGQTKTVTQNFIVLASGTSVTESATPSATPSFSPTPSASPSPLPKTGGIVETSLLFFAGVGIIILGSFVFYASAF